MPYVVKMFENDRGKQPVNEFIKKLDLISKAKISRMIDLLANYGPNLTMPHCRHLKKNIWELRSRGTNEIRVLYASANEGFILLHAFKKKTQETPQKEIDIAEYRFSGS